MDRTRLQRLVLENTSSITDNRVDLFIESEVNKRPFESEKKRQVLQQFTILAIMSVSTLSNALYYGFIKNS